MDPIKFSENNAKNKYFYSLRCQSSICKKIVLAHRCVLTSLMDDAKRRQGKVHKINSLKSTVRHKKLVEYFTYDDEFLYFPIKCKVKCVQTHEVEVNLKNSFYIFFVRRECNLLAKRFYFKTFSCFA